MFAAGQHIFQVLTKRPDAMLEYFSADNPRYTARKIADAAYEMEIRDHCFDCDIYFPLPNVWLGVSVENQAAAHKRIPMLLKTPAAARFISAEPLLGSVDLTEIRDRDEDVDCLWNSLAPYHEFLNSDSMDIVAAAVDGVTKLDWVICGGESGPGARPMHPDWARSLRDQCHAAGVPYFFKQWGEWLPARSDGGTTQNLGQILNCSDEPWRVGKKAAGALLDGRDWKQFREIRK